MHKKRLLIIPVIILAVLVGICVAVLSGKTDELTVEEAKAKLLEHMADDPNIEAMEIWDEEINPDKQVIDIKDRQGMRTESVYNFSFRYNDNMPGMEERLAGDYAISLDGKNVYWYDPVNDWHIDYNDRDMYNPSTGEWADNKPSEMQSDDITEQANDIIKELTPALAAADSILSRKNIKFDEEKIEAKDSNGNTDTYYKYAAPYDTVDACMEAMHECYTDEMCEKIYSTFFDMNNDDRWPVFYVNNDGVVYVPDGEIYHIRFTMPIATAEKVGEDKIIAKTNVIQQDGSEEFEIGLKKEDGIWKVDGLSVIGSEASIPYAFPDES